MGLSGQKRIDQQQIIYASFNYNLERRFDVDGAIDRYPYDLDPFVLTDSTKGDFRYHGPQLHVIYQNAPGNRWSFGASIDYRVSHGVEWEFARPEITERYLSGSVDLIYKLASTWQLGFTLNPFQRQTVTTLKKQPDGHDPYIYRYRGEFTYRPFIGRNRRQAVSEGIAILPQIAWSALPYTVILMTGYTHRRDNVFDLHGVDKTYDGFFLSDMYRLRAVARYKAGRAEHTRITLSYDGYYLDNAAETAQTELLFYQDVRRLHRGTLVLSRFWPLTRLWTALRFGLQLSERRADDYLAHRFRNGAIRYRRFGADVKWSGLPSWIVRAGGSVSRYREDAIWAYYGDFNGWHVHTGIEHTNAGNKTGVLLSAGNDDDTYGLGNVRAKRNFYHIECYMQRSF